MASGSNSNADPQNDPEFYFNLLRARRAKLEQWAETIIPLSAAEIEEREAIRKGLRPPPQEEDLTGLFRPERAGLGAEHLVADKSDSGSSNRFISAGGELEKLRKKLLGSKATARQKQDDEKGHPSADKSKSAQKPTDPGESSDSDEGRASAFKSKRPDSSRPIPNSEMEDGLANKRESEQPLAEKQDNRLASNKTPNEGKKDPNSSTGPTLERPAKRSSSFLDEMLSAKANKKRRKQKHKGDAGHE